MERVIKNRPIDLSKYLKYFVLADIAFYRANWKSENEQLVEIEFTNLWQSICLADEYTLA